MARPAAEDMDAGEVACTPHQLEASTLLLASHVLGFFFTNVFAHVSQNMMDLSCSWSWSGLVTLFSDFV